MAKKTKTKSAIPNWKKKKWFEILAPSAFGDKSLGETFCEDPKTMVGRVVKVNLMNLTDNPRKQNLSMSLKVTRVNDNKGFTTPIKLQMLPAYIRRLVRSGRDRIDLSFTAKSKDGAILRIKPLIVTKSNISSSTRTDIRVKAEEYLTKYITENAFETVFGEVARSNLQRDFRNILNKVSPMKLVEIRVVEIELKKGERIIPDLNISSTEETEKEVKTESNVEIKSEEKAIEKEVKTKEKIVESKDEEVKEE